MNRIAPVLLLTLLTAGCGRQTGSPSNASVSVAGPHSASFQNFLSRVRVRSCGRSESPDGQVSVDVDSQPVASGSGTASGLHMVVWRDNEIVSTEVFDTSSSAEACVRFADSVDGLPLGTIVVVAACGDAAAKFDERGQDAIHSIGGLSGLLGKPLGCSYYVIGATGFKPGAALEAWSIDKTVGFPMASACSDEPIAHLKRVIRGHVGPAGLSRISSNGLVASTSSLQKRPPSEELRTIKIWEIESGTLVQTLRHEDQHFVDAALSPDGATVLGVVAAPGPYPRAGGDVLLWDDNLSRAPRKIPWSVKQQENSYVA